MVFVMGTRLPSAAATAPNLRGFAQLSADALDNSRASGARWNPPPSPRPARAGSEGADRPTMAGKVVMEGCPGGQGEARPPFSEVVADCVSWWFQDTLKEARSGDKAIQVLVGQMYYYGYGVPRNVQMVPLILGIWGGKGQGKSFQCELVFAKMGIN